jgi:amino acid transporter
VIANAYRRFNLWNANCGASFEWVGRAISPYLGFLTGWLMVVGSLIGSLAGVVVLAPSVLAIAGAGAASTGPNIAIATAVIAVMLGVAVVGIRITARTQVAMAAVEYTILIGFAVAGLALVLHHHPGTFAIRPGWFTLTGIGGRGNVTAGLLLAVFMYTGWDATIYVNEEVRHRRTSPGRAAMLAVVFLAVIFAAATIGLQGVVSPARLHAHSTSALVYTATALGGAGWAKVMALALALSVIASTGTGIVIIARLIYSMAAHRVPPG